MERIVLMVGKGANRLMAGRLSCHRPDGESRRVPDDRMLWTGTAVMRFADFHTINSFLSNTVVLRRQSRHIFGVPVGNRPTLTRRDVAPEHPILNEHSPGCTPRTPPARAHEVA
jgi:hypothetical protein